MATKIASLIAGVVLAAAVGTAQAGEPMKLTGEQMDGVTAGMFLFDSLKGLEKITDITKVLPIKNIEVKVIADVDVKVGKLAEAGVFAHAGTGKQGLSVLALGNVSTGLLGGGHY